MRILIPNMKKADIELIYSSPAVSGSNRPVGLYDRYDIEQEMDESR